MGKTVELVPRDPSKALPILLRESIQGVFYLSPIVIVGRGELQYGSLPVYRRLFSDIWTPINFILASKLISQRAYVY